MALYVFFFPLHYLWFLKAKPFLMSKHICTHVCEHLAVKCATFNTSGQGIFVLAVIFDYLDKHASVCIGACSHPPTQTHAHTRIHASLLTKHLPPNTHPSIHPTTCTYTRYTHVDIISGAQLRLQACPVPMALWWPGEEELISAPGPSLSPMPWLRELGGRCHAGPQCGMFLWPKRIAFNA